MKRIFDASWRDCLRRYFDLLGELRAQEHDRVAKQEAVFGPAERDDVGAAVGRERPEVGVQRDCGIREAGSVDVEESSCSWARSAIAEISRGV